MRFLASCLLLFWACIAQAQLIETKNFAPKWVTLPAPQAPTYQYRLGGDPGEVGGRYAIAICLHDLDGKVSPMSDPVILTPTLKRWQLQVEMPDMPVWTKAFGWSVWSWRLDPFPPGYPYPPAAHLEFQPRVYGAQLNVNPTNSLRPILPFVGNERSTLRHFFPLHRAVRWYPGGLYPEYADNTYWPKSTTLGKPKTPKVQLLEFPNKRCKVAIAWVGNRGESPLSPEIVCPPEAIGSEYSSGIAFHTSLLQRPQGALGIHVYLKFEENDGSRKPWVRQPAPHVHGDPVSANDYLWPLTQTRHTMLRYKATGPAPVGGGESLLSPLHQALEAGTGSVLVNTDQTIHCPIIHNIHNSYGTVIKRHIKAPHSFPWQITTSTSAGGPTEWPVWVEAAQATYLDWLTIQSNTATAGIDYGNWHDSACFSTQTNHLNIHLTGDNFNVGIHQREDGVSNNGHGASESRHTYTVIQAKHPVINKYNQSVNWKFVDRFEAVSTGGIHCALVDADNSSSVRFFGDFLTTGSAEYSINHLNAALFNWEYDPWADPDAFRGGRSIFAMGSSLDIELNNLFCDQGFPAWVTCFGYGGKRIAFSIDSTNQWANWLNVVESPNGQLAPITMEITGSVLKPNNPFSPRVIGKADAITVIKPATLTSLDGMTAVRP